MKSIIAAYVQRFCLCFHTVLKNSVFWKWLSSIHSSFSKGFAESGIVNLVKKKGKTPLEDTSIACKILRIPTAVLSYFCNLFSKVVKNLADKSMAGKYVKAYVGGWMSLDVRFISMIILFASASGFAINLFRGRFVWQLIIVSLLAFLLTFVKVRLMDYFDGSVVVNAVKKIFGFENIEFSKLSRMSSSYTFLSGAVVGILSGVLGAFMPILCLIPIGLFGLGTVTLYPIIGIFCAVFLAPIVPTMILVGICLYTTLAVLVQKAYTGQWQIKMGRCGLSLMLFLLISVLSTVFSLSLKGSIGVLGMYIIFIGFYYIIRDTVRSGGVLEGMFKTFSLSALLVSVYGLLQYVFKWETTNAWIDEEMFEEATFRVYSTLANPNVLGEYLILALPIIALVIVNYTKNNWQKIVYGIFFIITLLCLVLTQSRGCWIGFFVSAFIFITYFKSSIWKVLPFFLLLLPFVLPETIINRLLSVGDMSDSSTSYRVYIWLGTLSMMSNFWIGGIGLGEGAFKTIYPYYSYSGIVAPHSHNLFLQILVESGIGALIVFVASCLIFIKDMINVQAKGRKYGIVATALMSAVLGFLVQSMFDYTFYNYRVMCVFFMVLALGGALVSVAFKEAKELDTK